MVRRSRRVPAQSTANTASKAKLGISLTSTGSELLNQMAKQAGLTKSELVQE